MKAIQITRFGGPEVLQSAELPVPQPGPGEVLVRLQAAGVNPVETYIRSGHYPKLPPLPDTPGSDGAGTVEAHGDDVRDCPSGARVYVGGALTGTYAEFCLAPAEAVHALPDNVSFPQGAALGVPYATAWRGLMQRGEAQRGEMVLIHGATGGVGLAAVQLALAAGLRVLATGGTEEGRTLLRELGAEAVFDHGQPEYVQQMHDFTGGAGVPLILEMLANRNLPADLKLLAKRGRVIVIGSRGPVEIDPRETMMRDADIRGLALQNASSEELAEAHRAIGTGLIAGTLQPIISCELPLGEAPKAHELVIGNHAPGKIVLIP